MWSENWSCLLNPCKYLNFHEWLHRRIRLLSNSISYYWHSIGFNRVKLHKENRGFRHIFFTERNLRFYRDYKDIGFHYPNRHKHPSLVKYFIRQWLLYSIHISHLHPSYFRMALRSNSKIIKEVKYFEEIW